MQDNTYNGWKNRATWNIALHLQNNEGLYRCTQDFMRTYKGRSPYPQMVKQYGLTDTDDGIRFDDAAIDIRALNCLLYDIKFGR